jgi:hypothetical protein
MTTTRGSGSWRAANWGPGCDKSVITAAYWIIDSGKIQCHQVAVPAFRALGRVMRQFGYHARREVTGCYNCRPITGGQAPSAHAQGIALDVNWDTNPYRLDKVVTDMPRSMVEAILELTTNEGIPLFRWGGDWDNRPDTPNSNYDAMHFEVIATPDELRHRVIVPEFDETDIKSWPLLAIGERGPAVQHLQQLLNAVDGISNTKDDGIFGLQTAQQVGTYQMTRQLPQDAVVGLGTWTALFTNQPAIGPNDVTTHKGMGSTQL